jgi:DNA-binding PadR family transcriptional regulator
MVRRSSEPAELTAIAFEVLLSVAERPRHGYGIKLEIEERTKGELILGSGTLYQAIQRLERDGLIADAPEPRGDVDPRRGRVYRLQPDGRAALDRHLRRLARAVAYARAHKLLPGSR